MGSFSSLFSFARLVVLACYTFSGGIKPAFQFLDLILLINVRFRD
jgi:hypothetical protein